VTNRLLSKVFGRLFNKSEVFFNTYVRVSPVTIFPSLAFRLSGITFTESFT
jgi:hypothetical protein